MTGEMCFGVMWISDGEDTVGCVVVYGDGEFLFPITKTSVAVSDEFVERAFKEQNKKYFALYDALIRCENREHLETELIENINALGFTMTKAVPYKYPYHKTKATVLRNVAKSNDLILLTSVENNLNEIEKRLCECMVK